MDEEQIVYILNTYKDQVKNIREALRLVNMRETDILYHTMNLPDMEKLTIEEISGLYSQIKVMVVLYLNKLGLSNREIARRLGGHTYNLVNKIITDNKGVKKDAESSSVRKTV